MRDLRAHIGVRESIESEGVADADADLPGGKGSILESGGKTSILECLPLILSAVGRLSLGKASYIRGAIKRMTPWTQDRPMAQTRALFHSEEQDGVWLRP